MIILIILTCIAVITLLVGFFEIRIPFIYRDQIIKKQNTAFPQTGVERGNKIENIPVKTVKNFLRPAKSGISYHLMQDQKTPDIA